MKKLAIILSAVSLLALAAFSIPTMEAKKQITLPQNENLEIQDFQSGNNNTFDFDAEAE